MEAAEDGWGAGVVLSVTGVPLHERAEIQQLLERAGGRYSPTLSRRCTHLAVPTCAQQQQAGPPSEKLRIAWRNRQKWGLQVVDLRWVLECAQAQQRLDEAAFPVQPPPSITAAPAGKEQAAPNASAALPESSRFGSKGGGNGCGDGGGSDDRSALAAETYLSHRSAGLPAATVAAAAARAQRAANPLCHSVNSRPLTSFGQPARSLQSLRTQAPSAQVQAPSGSVRGRVRWQVGPAAPSDNSCSPSGHGAAAVLPEQLERHHWAHQEEAAEDPFAEPWKLPMTQAGFLPGADLLEQLRASTAGLPLADSKRPEPLAAQQQQQEQGGRAVPAAPAGAAVAGSRDASPQAHPQRQAVLAWEPGRHAVSSLPLAAPPFQSTSRQQQSVRVPVAAAPGVQLPAADVPAQCQQEPAMSAAGQLQRLHPCASAPVQQRQQQAGSTAELARQLQACVGMQPIAQQQQQQQQPQQASLLQQALPHPQDPQPAPQLQLHHQAPPTDELLQQLWHSSCSSLPAPQLQAPCQRQQSEAFISDLLQQLQLSASRPGYGQQTQQTQQQAHSAAVPAADLLDQLRSFRSAAEHGQPGGSGAAAQQAGTSVTELVQQLRASASGANGGQQQLQQQRQLQDSQQQPATDTAELLAQLQAAGGAAPGAAAWQQQGGQPILATADLLQQLKAQAVGVPAAAAPQQRQAGPSTADLLQQLRAAAAMPVGAALPGSAILQQEAGQAAVGPSDAAGAAAGGASPDLAGLLQRLQELAPVSSPAPRGAAASTGQWEDQQRNAVAGVDFSEAVQCPGGQASAAAANPLPALPSSLPGQYRPQHGQPALAAAAACVLPHAAASGRTGGGRTTEDLLQLLRQQAQQGAAHGPPMALPDAVTGSSDELLQKLRSLAPQHSFTPLPRQLQQRSAAAAVAAKQAQLPLACRAAAPEDEEAPSTKYQRMQLSPAGSRPQPAAAVAARGGQEQREGSPLAAAALGQQRAAAPVCAGGDGGELSLAPTAVVLGSQAGLSPAGSPASSASSPAVCTVPEALESAAAAVPLPAGGGSGHNAELATAASQVAESSGRVFAEMLALVDPSLQPEEQQRVCTALRQGGAQLADGGGLCSGVTHVVCRPEAALKWLSMGVGIVSPQWVLQSLRSGKQHRCLTVSADASRHLPAASAVQLHAASDEGCARRGIPRQPTELKVELLTSREARQQMLSQLLGGGGSLVAVADCCAADGAGGAAAHQQVATPSELLGGVLWSVTDPPAAATKDNQHAARAVQQEDDTLTIPDSEEEEESQLCFVSASQAAVADLLHETAAAPGRQHQHQAAGAAPWQEAVVLRGPAELVLLLPRDARGELGLDTRCFPLSAQQRQLTAGQLLRLVHQYYQEQLPPQEQLQLLQSFPAAKGVAAVLRPAFLELASLSRGALLGSRINFEGLRKTSREPAAAVYEVQLGC